MILNKWETNRLFLKQGFVWICEHYVGGEEGIIIEDIQFDTEAEAREHAYRLNTEARDYVYTED